MLALVNAIGNTSSVYGSRIWPSANAPKYQIGFGVTSGFVGCGAVVAFVAGFAFKRWPDRGSVEVREKSEGDGLEKRVT